MNNVPRSYRLWPTSTFFAPQRTRPRRRLPWAMRNGSMSPLGVVAPWGGMFKHTALDQIVGVVSTQAHPYIGVGRGAVNAPARHLMRVGKVCASERETGPSITAMLERGPLAGRRIDVDVVEGRPPKTIDVRADDGSSCRYCLADWVQTGPSAIYTFLYRL